MEWGNLPLILPLPLPLPLILNFILRLLVLVLVVLTLLIPIQRRRPSLGTILHIPRLRLRLQPLTLK